MNKASWKVFYRQLRIVRRESAKAATDMMIYGSGFVRISKDGFVNHLLPQHVWLEHPRDGGSLMEGSSAPTPSLPSLPNAPAPPPMFGAMQAGLKKKPKKQATQPSFLGTEAATNPTNTGQNQLLGQ